VLYVNSRRLRKVRVKELFWLPGDHFTMSDDLNTLCRATADDVADALAFALRFQVRKKTHNADEIMSLIVSHLERSGFVVMKKQPIAGAPALGRGHEADDYRPAILRVIAMPSASAAAAQVECPEAEKGRLASKPACRAILGGVRNAPFRNGRKRRQVASEFA
jgi:hypothetical protein